MFDILRLDGTIAYSASEIAPYTYKWLSPQIVGERGGDLSHLAAQSINFEDRAVL